MADKSAAEVKTPAQKGVGAEESGSGHCPHCSGHNDRLTTIETHLGINGPSGLNAGSEADPKMERYKSREKRDERMARRKRS